MNIKDAEFMKKVLEKVGKQTREYFYSVSSRLAEKHDSELVNNTKLVVDILVENRILREAEGVILWVHSAMYPWVYKEDFLENEVPKASLEV